MILHARDRWSRAIDRDHFYSTSFGVGHTDIADTSRIPPYFRRNLLVTGHFLRARGVVTLLHRKFLEVRVGARGGITSVDGYFAAGTANSTPIRHFAGKNLLHLFFRERLHRVTGINDHGNTVV